MERTIADYIREDEAFRQILLKQDGGIMKYWAEHPDADGIEALYNDYREQCIHDFREANKWSMSENEIKGAALAEDHIRKELACQAALKPELAKFQEIAEQANQIVDGYTDHAFRELYQRRNSGGVQPKALYNEVIGAYNSPFGVAFQCLLLVLDEHRGVRRKDDSGERLWAEFKARKYATIYMARFKKLRQAVDEMIEKSTQNRSEEESRQICRQLAEETMKRLKRFTRMVNGDCDLVKIPDESGGFVTWSTKDFEQLGYDVSRGFKKEYIVVSKEEMSWLRGGMMYRTPEDSEPWTHLQECFQRYYHVLERIGSIWAAQLLVRGIDMRELERETGCVMSLLPDELYYVDRDYDDHRGDCCVYDMREARALLENLKHSSQDNVTPDEYQELPVSEEQKGKEQAQRLLATNDVFKLSGDEEQKKREILRLYKFIKIRFVKDIRYKYEWYALRRFLDKYNLLKECDNKQFACQMNKEEWFGYLKNELQCSAYSINTYNYLRDEKLSSNWIDKEIPKGSRASKSAVRRIYSIYENLVLYAEEIMNK